MEELKDIDSSKSKDASGGGGENVPIGHKEELTDSQCQDCNDGGVGDVGEEKSVTRVVGLNDVDAVPWNAPVTGESGGECACCLFWSLLCLNVICGIMHLT
ncbi:uncharacterized protein LOC113499049 [Trichoplusia ni]|uniref:Uncharacterized protein LOC113499041 n=1 Tax=Trichoplusia ni TaxID=7111 RepID=A0A7E5W3K1_TRINI|nr:uncharacterized protein LOC113499041 [Trichoplusia ni]XP_026735180.1 uncharacterized protein LOC113499049 [Trichoplusia ni]